MKFKYSFSREKLPYNVAIEITILKNALLFSVATLQVKYLDQDLGGAKSFYRLSFF